MASAARPGPLMPSNLLSDFQRLLLGRMAGYPAAAGVIVELHESRNPDFKALVEVSIVVLDQANVGVWLLVGHPASLADRREGS
jgi:hypothetical protein